VNPALLLRFIAVPVLALAAAGAAFVYFRARENPPAVATPPQATAPAAPQTRAPAEQAAPPQATAALPQSTPAAPPAKPPEFDVVRVTPGGETVVAGRAPGAARVELLDNGKPIASEKVDPSGQFVLLPPSLSGGDHLLALRITPEGQAPVASNQSVAVAVRPGTSPIVTLAEPGKPSVVLAAPGAADPGAKPAAASTPTATGQVTIRTAEVEAGGRFFATGTAPTGSTVRLYLNGSHVADAGAGSDGKWSLTIGKGVSGGKYALRADAVDAQGKVLSRAEVPFDAPVAVAAAAPVSPVPSGTAAPNQTAAAAPPAAPAAVSPPSHAPAAAGSSAPAPTTQAANGPQQTGTSVAAQNSAANPVVAEINTATVSRGDSLWRISRSRLGKGTRYTVIYEANSSQIRNPNLIYPGQVLVMPQQ
jgi:nucleoid-associated protein YgaU